jgi:ABC-type maltose transport system permease subunit
LPHNSKIEWCFSAAKTTNYKHLKAFPLVNTLLLSLVVMRFSEESVLPQMRTKLNHYVPLFQNSPAMAIHLHILQNLLLVSIQMLPRQHWHNHCWPTAETA